MGINIRGYRIQDSGFRIKISCIVHHVSCMLQL